MGELKLAMIVPEVVARPSGGGRMRLFQLQVILSQISQRRIAAWDLYAGKPQPVPLPDQEDEPPKRPVNGAVVNDQSSVLRDLVTLAVDLIPSVSVRALDDRHRSRILTWIDSTRPTHALVVHPYATDLVPALRHRGIRVFIDCQNVESDLARQLATLSSPGRRQLSAVARWRVIRRWETQHFLLADEVWLPSEMDTERQRHVCSGRVRTRCVPNALDISAYTPRTGGGSHDVVLPGSFGYPPNVVGGRLLRDQVLPVVQQSVPDSRLVLVGRDEKGLARELQREPDVVVTGEVPDTRPYLLNAGVVAVPILQGGGTRYKILEALALGLPVITTPLGCEGLDVRDGEHLLIRDIDGFPEAIVSILTDPDFGRSLGRKGRELIAQRYSWDVAEQIVREALGVPVLSLVGVLV